MLIQIVQSWNNRILFYVYFKEPDVGGVYNFIEQFIRNMFKSHIVITYGLTLVVVSIPDLSTDTRIKLEPSEIWYWLLPKANVPREK